MSTFVLHSHSPRYIVREIHWPTLKHMGEEEEEKIYGRIRLNEIENCYSFIIQAVKPYGDEKPTTNRRKEEEKKKC